MSTHPYLPRNMVTPPALPHTPPAPSRPHSALLINPFYPKDPHASFGKHVLTPTLALTSFAATTPTQWDVAYWDENLLDGPPPADPTPEVVGITVHLTFARRAFELAGWFRARGSKVVLGGLHVLSCPDECAPHADAIALGDGVQLWPRILRDVEAGRLQSRYAADYENNYRDDPPPRRSLVPRRSFLTTTSLIATRGCHNRCGFCYLATDGLRMPYRMRDPAQIAAEFAADGQPYAVFIDNNLGSNRDYLRRLCEALRPLDRIWSAAVTIDVTDDPSRVPWRSPAALASSSASNPLPMRTLPTPARRPRRPLTTPAASASFTTTASRSTALSSSASITTAPTYSPAPPNGSRPTVSNAPPSTY